MAVWNGGAYVHEAVSSVLRQTFSDFELLIVDDASTDGAIAELPRDERIRVLRNERNLGQVPSLNRGLQEARGAYVARLDADDVMLPTRLERQVAVLDANPLVALAGTWMDVVDDAGRRWGTTRGRIDSYIDYVAALLLDRIPFGHPSIMYRSDAVRALGGYEVSLAPSEDKDLYRRLALERHEARVVPEALVRYRRHEMQLSQLQIERQLANDHASQERFLTELAPHLPARTLRLVLAAEPAFWAEPPLGELESFLDGTTARLRLTRQEHEALGRFIAARCMRALRTGWSAQCAVDKSRAAAPAAFASAHGGPGASAGLALLPLLLGLRPVGVRLGSSRLRARRALRHSARMAHLRALAQRSRTLRRLYTALLGFRLLDDDIDAP